MRLSRYSDYSIRVLMVAALKVPERVTVDEVAQTFNISRNHLVKVVHQLGTAGYLQTKRGIGGGVTLGKSPKDIVLGEVARLGEETDKVIDCLDRENQLCRLYPACFLKPILDEAAAAFFAVLDRYSLEDLLKKPSRMREGLGIRI